MWAHVKNLVCEFGLNNKKKLDEYKKYTKLTCLYIYSYYKYTVYMVGNIIMFNCNYKFTILNYLAHI